MKKKIIMLALCVLMISGCGSKIPKLSNGDEAIVTLSDGSKISANELYEELKETYGETVLVNLIDKKILEDKYKDNLEEANQYVETQYSLYESYYGDSFESTLSSYGYTTDSFKEEMYLDKLRNYAILDYCKDQITDKEIEEYYDDEIVADIKVSHILITAEVTDDMTDEEKTAAENEAKEKINSIISELKDTKSADVATKFAELAKEYSEDSSTKEDGGSLGYINKDTLSSEYDELVEAAYKLKDGAYSTKVITTELGYHVILRTETKEKASLESVKDTILEELADEYLTDNQVAKVRGLQAVRKEYGVEIVDSEIQEKYADDIQSQLSYYEQEATSSTTE